MVDILYSTLLQISAESNAERLEIGYSCWWSYGQEFNGSFSSYKSK